MVGVAGQSFLLVERQINLNCAACCALVEGHQIFNRFAFIHQKRGDHDGTCVDHWVMRSVFFVKNWLIERDSAGLFADVLVYFIFFALGNVQAVQVRIGDYFADGLDREKPSVVAELDELAICRAEGGGKVLVVRLRQRRDVGCFLTRFILRVCLNLVERFLVMLAKRLPLRNDQLALQYSFDEVAFGENGALPFVESNLSII